MIWEIGKLTEGEHYLAFMLAAVFACILLTRNIRSERVNQGSFWITLIVCLLLIAQDILEIYAQMDQARRTLRLITSIAGYTLRPMAVLGFLLVIWPSGRPSWFLWIPAAVNGLLYATALFTPLTFTFNENYSFERGPLSRFMFVVCIGYMILVLFMIHIRFKDRRAGDTFVIYLCAVGCLGAMAVDVVFEGITIISAILISSMTFYLFLRAQDMDHDPLTKLHTRRVFYEDCGKHRTAVTAVASIDMNGLKKTNDERGHEAGDRALRMIGRGLSSISSRKILTYRIGGDEFMILFIRCTEEEIRQAMTTFMDEIWKTGLTVAVGLATRLETSEPLEELIRISDKRMYEDKSEYYRQHDRRKKR